MSNELTPEQIDMLYEARRLDAEEVSVVPSSLAEAAYRLDETDLETLAEADSPTVVDAAAAVNGDEARDVLQAANEVDGPAVVVSKRDAKELTAAKEGLGAVVQQLRGLDESTVATMSLESLAAEVQAADTDTTVAALSDLSQMPETGDQPNNTESGSKDVDSLSYDERAELEALVDKRDRMKDRTPEYAERLEHEIADFLGADSFDNVKYDVEAL